MRLLIDSHALIWYVDQDNLLSPPHMRQTNDLLLSAGSIWEIGIKVGLPDSVQFPPPGRQCKVQRSRASLTSLHVDG